MLADKVKKSDETRSKILRAFTDCVVSNGYAQTKLVDIAEQAGLATPHLRYYFKNKESILEYQYERVVARFQDSILGIKAKTSEAWFDQFVKIVFNADPRSTRAQLVLMEANILVAHSQQMRVLKHTYDKNTLKVLEQQFALAGHPEPARAALEVFHFLTGLMLNTAFESREDWVAARPIFKQFVHRCLSEGKVTSASRTKGKKK